MIKSVIQRVGFLLYISFTSKEYIIVGTKNEKPMTPMTIFNPHVKNADSEETPGIKVHLLKTVACRRTIFGG